MTLLINAVYIVSSVLFIYGLKLLSSPASARKGNFLSALGMLLAISFLRKNPGSALACQK